MWWAWMYSQAFIHTLTQIHSVMYGAKKGGLGLASGFRQWILNPAQFGLEWADQAYEQLYLSVLEDPFIFLKICASVTPKEEADVTLFFFLVTVSLKNAFSMVSSVGTWEKIDTGKSSALTEFASHCFLETGGTHLWPVGFSRFCEFLMPKNIQVLSLCGYKKIQFPVKIDHIWL